MNRFALILLASLLVPTPAAAEPCAVSARPITDERAVFATVESLRVVPARARIGGTVAAIAIREGDRVREGAIIATVADEKLVLRLRALDADIAGLDSSLAQALADLARGEALTGSGTVTRARLDQLRTAVTVAEAALKARAADRAVLSQQLQEGAVLAPADGRVLAVPVTAGMVIMGGETVAMVADDRLVLRLRVPEEQARLLKSGDPVRLAGDEIGAVGTLTGQIALIYPQITDGRVTADATVEGIGGAYLGARVRVWIAAGQRAGILVPAACLVTRFGLDYALVAGPNGAPLEVPVQRGLPHAAPGMADGVEILSGLTPADRLVAP